ncbi:TatD family deoxyribonuclease [Atopobacter sp. AH10]|nr:TatD family deoxyribonuclease [Atopobacter sp. AH10]
MIEIFDTHCHLNAEEFDGKVDEAIRQAHELDVTRFAVVGFDYKTIEKAIELAEKYDHIWAIIGWHPTETHTYTKQVEDYLYSKLAHPRVVGLGETGLDYYWDSATPQEQERAFRRQMAMARDLHLPVIVHNREATDDCYKILKEEKVHLTGGIMHSYNQGPAYTEKFLDLGMHLSYSGVLTFKNAPEVRASAAVTPNDRYLLETDSPYLAPMPYRGKQNQPAYTHYVAQEMAKVRSVSYEQVAAEATRNALNLFGLNEKDC